MSKKRWGDYSRGQQAALLAGAAVEIVLTTVALWDLARRPSGQVRGSRRLWAVGCFVQPIGPVAYLAFGRHPA